MATDSGLQEIIDLLDGDDYLGILLAAQMGGTPEEVQLIVQVASFDAETEAIQPQRVFILRCIGVQEQRLSLGLFNKMVYVEEHPLLWNHNAPYRQIYFRGKAENVDGLMLELTQVFGQFYGPMRSMADNLNRAMPLGALLDSGHGLLGEMPLPMAEKVQAVLERYSLKVSLGLSDLKDPPVDFKLLVLDDSFLIAQMYSVEPMEGNKGS